MFGIAIGGSACVWVQLGEVASQGLGIQARGLTQIVKAVRVLIRTALGGDQGFQCMFQRLAGLRGDRVIRAPTVQQVLQGVVIPVGVDQAAGHFSAC